MHNPIIRSVKPWIYAVTGMIALVIGLSVTGQAHSNLLGASVKSDPEDFVRNVLSYETDPSYSACLTSVKMTRNANSRDCNLALTRLNLIARHMDMRGLEPNDVNLIIEILTKILEEEENGK